MIESGTSSDILLPVEANVALVHAKGGWVLCFHSENKSPYVTEMIARTSDEVVMLVSEFVRRVTSETDDLEKTPQPDWLDSYDNVMEKIEDD